MDIYQIFVSNTKVLRGHDVNIKIIKYIVRSDVLAAEYIITILIITPKDIIKYLFNK